LYILQENESGYLNTKIVIKINKKIDKDFITMELLSLDFGGFLIFIKIIIVAQNINKIDHPVIRA
tara:strand:+ start:274 stop:468 length:195 start_codon:yes stop_codon:yes gene_type:complete